MRWTGKVPFDLLEIQAVANGFITTFTSPINPDSLKSAEFKVRSWTYHQWSTYGSPLVDEAEHQVVSVSASSDGLSVHLQLSDLRPGFVHEIAIVDLESNDGRELLHDTGWYTLLAIPAADSTGE
ncbi:MAG: hypothetical protein COB96_01260 [Planctomycetota bacterium]|nr:MAG: hypothetical protein COB96_01260 [Planctomycetota bacterium]